MLKTFLLFFTVIGHMMLQAQAPVNDNCENADEILIPNNGFALGNFLSQKVDIEWSSRQKGEKCAKELEDNGNCEKTVWFKFYIPTTRNISVKLTQQDSAIPQIFAGFNIYLINNCNYSLGDLALELTPLNKFGESGNTCLHQGWYYIQVGSKQKAKGILWLELTSSAQANPSFDNYNQAYDFGLVKDNYKSYAINTGCASVGEKESQAIQDSSLSKSVFCSFTLPSNAIYNFVQCYSGTGKVKYRIFRDQINMDSVNSNKPFIYVSKNGYFKLLNEFCPKSTFNDRVFFVQFVVDKTNDYLNVSINNYTYQADAWNTPSTNDIINTYNGFTRTLSHLYNCEGQLKIHRCKNIIPEFYSKLNIDYQGDTLIDTFQMAGYTIINVSEAGTLTVVSKDRYNYDSDMFYALYQGDITQTCNLTFLTSEYTRIFNFCIKPGTYTLVTSLQKNIAFEPFSHIITQKNIILNTIHYHPKGPEKLGTFIPANQNIMRSTGINFNMQKDTSIWIDTLALRGYFIFREFYLSEKSNIRISDDNFNSALYVVKGQMSKGNAKLIKDCKYYGSYSFDLPYCTLLDSGFYTIIARLDTLKKTLPCVAPKSSISIYPPFICNQYLYNEATKAYKINNNTDVLSANANKKNLDYIFNLPYCIDCKSVTKDLPALLHYKKKYNWITSNTHYVFYTFYLGQNAEFRIPAMGDHQFELYNGNALINPALIKDSANIVSSCNYGNVYCNLQGGKFYTLVLFNIESSGVIEAYFTPHRISINDYANRAYDFGHFIGNSTKAAPAIPITCHTNGFESDPCTWQYDQKRCIRYANNMNIPYKDTQNTKRPYSRKNLWYTFTVENACKITAVVSAKTPLLKNPIINLYRYKGPYDKYFSNTISSQFDSTDKGMEWLAENPGYVSSTDNRSNNVSITNLGCGTNRYFIILDDEYYYDRAHYEYIITLTYQQININNNGDFCQTAVSSNINSYGSKSISANNTCHTYGNSPFETDSTSDIKSSWYKINISNLKSCDLKIRNTKGNGLLYFNVYGGTCGAMTKISHLTDLYSYFTLSCMGNGNYYIQAISKKNTNSDIEFEVSAIMPGNPNCKPYDFRMPIAQYKFNGGCNSDTLQFLNRSTSGKGVIYKWYINNIYFSDLENPFILLNNPLVRPKNSIRLLVTNTIDQLSDSISLTFEPDTNTYFFKIDGPANTYCSDTFTLKIKTNFPNKINYSWTDKYNLTPILTETRTIFYQNTDMTYYVQGESDNCKFRDSIYISLNKTMGKLKDTSLCPGEKIIIYPQPKEYLRVNYILVKDSFIFTKTGTYNIQYIYKNCWMEETFNLNIDTGKINNRQTDSVFACNKVVQLDYSKAKLLTYNWNTGEKTPYIFADKSGTYVLNGAINLCRNIEYTVHLTIDKVNIDVLQDLTVCAGDTISFKTNYPGFKVILKSPFQDLIIATKSFKEKLVLQKGQCIISDSAKIEVLMPATYFIDSFYCDTNGVFSMQLDAGEGLKYHWFHNNVNSRLTTIKDFGQYMVDRQNLLACHDTLSFSILEDCPLNVFIPNAFTPNNDILNEGFGPVISGQFQSFSIQIFNRWGEMLFESLDNKKWNGTYMNKLVQEGVYCFSIIIYDTKNQAFYFRGSLTLLY